MTFEWIGLATFLLGCLGLLVGPRLAVPILIASTIFGAAAAAILTALGGANLPPSHALLGFLILVAIRFGYIEKAVATLAFPKLGFWLLLTAVYGAVGAFFLPRIFAGATYVFTFARTDFGTAILLIPAGPVNGNLTQTIYFIGNLVAFCLFSAMSSEPIGRKWIVNGFLWATCLNLFFGVLDYVTYFTDTSQYLAFLRNAPYRMLDMAVVAGFKRLVGTFAEAAAFGATTLSFFAFTLTLWLNGYRTRLTGPLALASCVALVISTSGTAYGGLAIYLVAVYGSCLVRCLLLPLTPQRVGFLTIAPLVAIALGCGIALSDRNSTFVADAVQNLILSKGDTDSALERGSWNAQAMINFFDTYGLGLGIGSARASNTAIAVLANIGIPGAFTYAIFTAGILLAPLRDEPGERRFFREAAGSACLTLIIAGLLAGSFIDLGLPFFILAALAATPGEAAVEAGQAVTRSSHATMRRPRTFGRVAPA